MRFSQTLFLLLVLASSAFACADHDLPDASAAVQIVEATVNTSKVEGPLLVTVLGELKNTTRNRIDNLVVEAKLTDSNGKVVDVLSEPIYGLVVPAGQQVAFRLQGAAAASPNAYVGVEARVVSGESHVPSANRSLQKSSRMFELLISWAPMILLVLVWVFLARKYSGKGSTQDRMLAAIGEQNVLLAKQIEAIEAIASVVSSRKDAD